MKYRTWFLLLAALGILTLLGAAFLACGKSSSSSSSADDDDNDNDNDDASPDDDDDASPAPQPIKFAVVEESLDGVNKVLPGAECELINADGTSLNPPVTTISDSTGLCNFNGHTATIYSVKITMEGYLDSYAFNWPRLPNASWTFRMTTPAEEQYISKVLNNVPLDPTKGIIAGAINWISPEGAAQVVGCATASDEGGDTFYYTTDFAVPTMARSTANPVNGYYVTVNIPTPGPITLHATASGKQTNVTVPKVYENSLVYAPLFFYSTDFPTNPEPSDCTK